jgi:predicted phage tail protein
MDINVTVSLNGKIIKEHDLKHVYLVPNDCILFVPKIEDGGDIIRTIAMVALVAVAIAAPYLAPVSWGLVSATGGLTMAGALVSMGVMMLGGMMINALLPPTISTPVASLGDVGSIGGSIDSTQSTVYSWNSHTTQQQGIVIPKPYGIIRSKGNIISTYIENINDNQYLNILLCLGYGPISSISDYEINDQNYTNYSGITVETKYGNLDQTVISNFNDTKTEYSVASKVVYGTPVYYTTIGDSFDSMEIDITFPKGLFYSNDQGGLDAFTAQFQIFISKDGGAYTNIAPPYVQVTGAQNSIIRRTYKTGALAHGHYTVQVVKNMYEKNSFRYGDDIYLSAVREVYSDDFEHPRHILVGIKALATDQISGSIDFSCLVNGALVKTYRPSEVLGSDGYNYRCILSHVGSADTTPVTGVNWATYWEQGGSSAVLNSTAFAVGTVYSDVYSWRVEFSNNPAWVCYDVLSQPVLNNTLVVERYDGINPLRLDTDAFREWAEWCDELVIVGGVSERRITFNGIFDSESTLWEAAIKVCQMSRTTLTWDGVTIAPLTDKPGTPVQMFSVGNIITDSFKETFLSVEERASEIEVSFLNNEKNYDKDQINIFNSDISTNNRVSIDLIGITKASEVWREGMYRLYNNQYLLRTIEFQADVDAVACKLGDLVYVQHDVPSWSDGGSIKSATATTVELDKEVILTEGNIYTIKIRLNDGTLVDRFVTETSGTYSVLTVTTPFTDIPIGGEVYIFGVQNNAKPFRITGISYTEELRYTISAIEYNESIYNCDTDEPAIPTMNYSTISSLGPVTYLSATERLESIRGIVEVVIDVYFGKPIASFFKEAQIWYMDTSNTVWRYAGSSSTGYLKIIGGINELQTYTIKAVTKNILNMTENFDDAVTCQLFVYGKTLPPSDVTNFWGQGSIGGLRLDWEAVSDIDIDYYKLRYSTSNDDVWETSIDLATIKGTSITLPAAQDGIYFIKAVDTSGNESENAASVITTIPSILRWELLNTIDEGSFGGITINTVSNGEGGVYLASSQYAFVEVLLDDVINLDAIQDFDILDSYYLSTASPIYYGYYEATTTVVFSDVYDARCSAEVKFVGVDSGALFDDIVDFDLLTNFDSDIVDGVGVQPQIALSQDGVTWNADCVQGTDSLKYSCIKTHKAALENKPITGGDWESFWEVLATWTIAGGTWAEDEIYDDAEYQNFLIGDFRAMGYKFRLKLYTDNSLKYPLVTDLVFYVDLPDRVESEQDIMCYSTGIHKNFTKQFFTKPRMGITVQGAASGDYYDLSSVDLSGFTVTIKNSDIGVDRVIDWEAKGY